MKQPKETPQEPKDVGLKVDVQDEWDHSFEAAQGLRDLLSMGAGSDEGLTVESCYLLRVAADQLVDDMEKVNSFFNPGGDE